MNGYHKRDGLHKQAEARFGLLVLDFQEEYQLTRGEMLAILAETLQRAAYSVLRVERHGPNSGKKACEA